jgi:hypothetical protein
MDVGSKPPYVFTEVWVVSICARLPKQGLERWQASSAPFTSHVAAGAASAPPAARSGGRPASLVQPAAADAATAEMLSVIAGARRGLLVVGRMASVEDCVAALKIAEALQWPVAADVLSGAYSKSFLGHTSINHSFISPAPMRVSTCRLSPSS